MTLLNLILLSDVVVEHAYQLGNASQKQSLLMELYSTELQLFKDLALVKERRYIHLLIWFMFIIYILTELGLLSFQL